MRLVRFGFSGHLQKSPDPRALISQKVLKSVFPVKKVSKKAPNISGRRFHRTVEMIWSRYMPRPGSLKALLFPPLLNKVQNKGTQGARARYNAELPPIIPSGPQDWKNQDRFASAIEIFKARIWCEIWNPKDPSVLKHTTALESVVFCYRRSFVLSVPFSCYSFPWKNKHFCALSVAFCYRRSDFSLRSEFAFRTIFSTAGSFGKRYFWHNGHLLGWHPPVSSFSSISGVCRSPFSKKTVSTTLSIGALV